MKDPRTGKMSSSATAAAGAASDASAAMGCSSGGGSYDDKASLQRGYTNSSVNAPAAASSNKRTSAKNSKSEPSHTPWERQHHIT
eukprot:3827419-Amphidinium_carterae.1